MRAPLFQDNNEPWSDEIIAEYAAEYGCLYNDVCCICLVQIKTQIFRNSGVCSDQHRKDRDNDHEPFKAVNLRIHEGEDI